MQLKIVFPCTKPPVFLHILHNNIAKLTTNRIFILNQKVQVQQGLSVRVFTYSIRSFKSIFKCGSLYFQTPENKDLIWENVIKLLVDEVNSV